LKDVVINIPCLVVKRPFLSLVPVERLDYVIEIERGDGAAVDHVIERGDGAVIDHVIEGGDDTAMDHVIINHRHVNLPS